MKFRAVLPLTKTCTKKNASIKFYNARWAAILFGGILLLAVFVPYIIAVIRRTVNPLLPFISQAAGSPPQSGVFSVLLALCATVGFIGLHVLNLGICVYQERIAEEKQRLLRFFNKASLVPGHLALLGMILVGGFPIDFRRNNEDWILVTIVPHLTGAIILFGGGVAYCSILTLIMYIVFPHKKKLMGLRVVLLLVTILSALIHATIVRKAFGLEYYDEDRLKTCDLKIFEYDTNYLICSVCEWVMAVAFISTFLTLEHEGKMFSITLSVDLLENNGEGQEQSNDFLKPLPEPEPSFGSSENILGTSSKEDNNEETRVKS